MKSALSEIKDTEQYNHLPILKRVSMFFWNKKWLFIFLAVSTWTFNAWGNGLGAICAKMERMGKKYKLRWI